MYIQENLTTSSIEIPEISWILPAELESKFWQHGSFSKLIFNDDKTAVIDIVEDTGKRAEYEAFIAKEQERIAEEKFNQKSFVPSPEASAVTVVKQFLLPMMPLTTEDGENSTLQILLLSGLFDTWKPGDYAVGEIRNINNQTWTCKTAHNDPKITPESENWFTYWKPLHGVSAETARPFVQPRSEDDVYRTGEYAWIHRVLKKCISDTMADDIENPDSWADA